MSDQSTKRIIEMYMEEAEAPMFLSGFFQTPPRNFHTSEKVEIDIIRDDEDVAIVITDLSVGGRLNEATEYTNKAFTPPIFNEMGAIKAYDLIKRTPGVDPFQDPNYGANALREAVKIFRRLERKIRRAIELMASQVLQTGTLTLIDQNGTALYTLDFKPKATHLATAAAAWSGPSDKLKDIEDLAVVVRRDGKRQPKVLIFGKTAWKHWLDDENVRARFDQSALNIAQLMPQPRGTGATFQGFVWIGNYRFEMWTYDGWYKHPQTGALTPYVEDDNVIMLSEGGRLDLSFGAIPRIAAPDPRAMPFLPPRMSSPERGLDLTTNAWITPDGKSLMVEAGTRPLTIPTAIDTFACLDTSP